MPRKPRPTALANPSVSAPEAFERMLPQINALPASELVHLNLSPPLVVTTVLGSLPEVRALRPRIVRELPYFDIQGFDELELKARALSHAHALAVGRTIPPRPLADLLAAGTKLRDMLLSDAQALIKRDLLDGTRLQNVKRTRGHRALAVDLQVLAACLREEWNKLVGRSFVTLQELDQAVMLADELLRRVGERNAFDLNAAEALAVRHRAYSLVVRGYEDARRAIRYLRDREGDVDVIAPSLFVARNRAMRRGSAAEQTNGKGNDIDAGTGA